MEKLNDINLIEYNKLIKLRKISFFVCLLFLSITLIFFIMIFNLEQSDKPHSEIIRASRWYTAFGLICVILSFITGFIGVIVPTSKIHDNEIYKKNNITFTNLNVSNIKLVQKENCIICPRCNKYINIKSNKCFYCGYIRKDEKDGK